MASLTAARKAHLLFSPNVLRRTVLCLALEAALLAAVAAVPSLRYAAEDLVDAVELRLLKGAHSLAWWSLVSLLASSCCALQIILSAASLGCSGLNALLGPVRPPLLAATVLLQASAWRVVATRKPEQAPTVAVGSLVTLALTLLPEALHLVETRRRLRRPSSEARRTLALRLAKVGCTSCEATVRATAEATAGVLRCDVSIDTGVATVAIADDVDAAALEATLVRALADAGFDKADGAACARPPPKETEARRADAPAACGALVGGLLGSSCCAVQLGFNLLGLGCSGLNVWLGPWRPWTRAATATFFALRWASAPPQRRRALLAATFVAAVLTFLPEILLYAGSTALAPPTGGAVRLELKVEGMGCEACQLAVAGALQRASGVLDAAADFETGTASLLVQPSWGLELGELAARVEAAGFELDVENVSGAM